MIINPYQFAPAASVAWSSATKHSAIIISGLTISQTNRDVPEILYASARLNTAYSGKAYHSFRVHYRALGGIIGVGTVNGTQSLTSSSFWLGLTNSGAAWGPDDSSYVGGVSVGPGFDEDYAGFVTVDYDIAVDTSTRKVWIRKSGGSWIGGGNPATGTTPTYTSPSAAGGLFFGATLTRDGENGTFYEVTALLGGSALGTPPSGYSVWGG